MGIGDFFKGRKPEALVGSDEERESKILRSRNELAARREWLERAERRGDRTEIGMHQREIAIIIDQLKELGVDVEEEEREQVAA